MIRKSTARNASARAPIPGYERLLDGRVRIHPREALCAYRADARSGG